MRIRNIHTFINTHSLYFYFIFLFAVLAEQIWLRAIYSRAAVVLIGRSFVGEPKIKNMWHNKVRQPKIIHVILNLTRCVKPKGDKSSAAFPNNLSTINYYKRELRVLIQMALHFSSYMKRSAFLCVIKNSWLIKFQNICLKREKCAPICCLLLSATGINYKHSTHTTHTTNSRSSQARHYNNLAIYFIIAYKLYSQLSYHLQLAIYTCRQNTEIEIKQLDFYANYYSRNSLLLINCNMDVARRHLNKYSPDTNAILLL